MRIKNSFLSVLVGCGTMMSACAKEKSPTPPKEKETKTDRAEVDASKVIDTRELIFFKEDAPHFTNRQILDLRLVGARWQYRARSEQEVYPHGGGYSKNASCGDWQDMPAQGVVRADGPQSCDSEPALCMLIAEKTEVLGHEGEVWRIRGDIALSDSACE